MNKYPSYADSRPGENKNQYDAQPGTNQPFNRYIQELVCIDAVESKKRVHLKNRHDTLLKTFRQKKPALITELSERCRLERAHQKAQVVGNRAPTLSFSGSGIPCKLPPRA